jgi:hypothetical protein
MFIKPTCATLLAFLFCTQANFGQESKVNCKPLAGVFSKSICTVTENNKVFVVKDQLQKRSNEQSLHGLQRWTREHYHCIRCEKDAGFDGGTLLRKVVFDNALSIAFFLVYDVRVNMNFIEIDGRTLLDWLQDDTEKTFDAAFEADAPGDKQYLLKQLQINQKYFNLFHNNGAKFRHVLEEEARRQSKD